MTILIHVHMLDDNGLLALAAMLIERFYRLSKDARELGTILKVEIARPKTQSHDP
jgi:hypothetical protein